MNDVPSLKRHVYTYDQIRTLCDVHAELAEQHYDLLDALYQEGIFTYGQALDEVIGSLRKLIVECEDLLQEVHPYKKFTSITRLLFGRRGDVVIVSASDSGDIDSRDVGLPNRYTSWFISLAGDTRLWHDRWQHQLSKYRENTSSEKNECLSVVSKRLSKSVAKRLQKIVHEYYWILGLLRDLQEYSGGQASKKHTYQEAEILTGRVRFNPSTSEVFYGRELVSKPKSGSREEAVWRLLFKARGVPFHKATFSLLETCKDSDGRQIFRTIGDEITSDIRKWNKKFERHKVQVLHKSGKAITLWIKQLQ